MNRIALVALAASAALFAGAAQAQQAQTPPAPPLIDWDKIEIKTTDLGNKTYMLEGQGGNITVAVGTDGIIMVDGQFAPLSAKIKAAIAAISPLPIKYLVNTHYPRRPYRRKRELRQGRRHRGGAGQHPRPPRRRHHEWHHRRQGGAAGRQRRLPKETYIGGTKTLEVGGRTALLTHITNAHTDGDTWVYFADANVLCTGDTSNNTKRYQSIDFANGGDIRGMIAAQDAYLAASNDDTKIVVGHGPLAKKSDVAEFRAMLVTARDRIEKLFNDGKSEAEVVAARPLAGSRCEMGRDRCSRGRLHAHGLQLVQAIIAKDSDESRSGSTNSAGPRNLSTASIHCRRSGPAMCW